MDDAEKKKRRRAAANKWYKTKTDQVNLRFPVGFQKIIAGLAANAHTTTRAYVQDLILQDLRKKEESGELTKQEVADIRKDYKNAIAKRRAKYPEADISEIVVFVSSAN